MDCAPAFLRAPLRSRLARSRAMRLAQPYRGLYRHSGIQPMLWVLAGVELDSHRQALHHLHVVAGCILRGQQAEAIATRAGQVPDVARVVAAEGIDVDCDFLAAMHPGELRLLEVRSHPD